MKRIRVPVQKQPAKWEVSHARVKVSLRDAEAYGDTFVDQQMKRLIEELTKELAKKLTVDMQTDKQERAEIADNIRGINLDGDDFSESIARGIEEGTIPKNWPYER